MSKRYTFKIPQNILVIYSKFDNNLIFKNKYDNTLLFVKTLFKIRFSNNNTFEVTSEVLNNNSINKKQIKRYLNTQSSLIKQCLSDILSNQHRKLIFVGLGYKFFLIENNRKLLQLKLGYSHDIYVKVPLDITLKWYNQNSIYLSGRSTNTLSIFSNKIKSYKIPDAYLGKGILFANEKLYLKKGKQV